MKQLLLFVFFVLSLQLTGQKKVFMSGGETIDKDRYKDVKGDPFLYDEVLPIVVLEANGKKIDGVHGRFNAHTGNVEVQQEDGFIPLDERKVLTVLFVKEQDSIQFAQGRAFGINQAMVVRLYTGNNYDLVYQPQARITDKTFQDVGKTIRIKRFRTYHKYFLINEDGEKKEVKLKDKEFTKIVGVDFKKAAKKRGVKLKKAEDFVKLMTLENI